MQSSLDGITELLAFDAWHTSTIKAFMIYVRELLEAHSLKGQYRFLNLYCNWCAHTKISESPTAFQILLDLTNAICAHNSNPKKVGDLHKVINETLGFESLRTELVKLLQRFRVDPARIVNDRDWRAFVNLLLQKLQEKPIAFERPVKPKFKKIFTDIQKAASDAGQPDWAVIALSFTNHASYICWEIKTDDLIRSHVRLVGPVAVGQTVHHTGRPTPDGNLQTGAN